MNTPNRISSESSEAFFNIANKQLEATPTLTFGDTFNPQTCFKSPCLSRKKTRSFIGNNELSSGDKKFDLSQKAGLHQCLGDSA